MFRVLKNQKIALTILVLVSGLLFIAAYVNTTPQTPLDIVQNETLSKEEQFAALAALAYSDNQDPEAFFLLYNKLYYGHGTPPSPETALTMLNKSASAGYGVAQEELGFIYLNGTEHYKKDTSLAYHWLNKAARSGMIKSKEFLHINN